MCAFVVAYRCNKLQICLPFCVDKQTIENKTNKKPKPIVRQAQPAKEVTTKTTCHLRSTVLLFGFTRV